MRPIPAFALAITLGSIAPAQENAPESAPPASAPSAEPTTFAAEIEAIRARHDLPALAGAVVRDGEIVALAATGRRAHDQPDNPIALDDRWHIGSDTKSMTSVLAAMFVEEGLIDWQTTVGEVFKDQPDFLERVRDEYESATLEQLLGHRAGLPSDRVPDWVLFGKVRELDGPMLDRRREAAALAMMQEPVAAPGESFAYSNFGYVIAGAMLEHLTGRPWEDLMRERLFEPWGLESAGFGPPGAESSPQADQPHSASQPWGHRPGFKIEGADGWKPVEPWNEYADNPAVLGPAGTVHLNLRDWAEYATMQLRGARLWMGLDPAPDDDEGGDRTVGRLSAASWEKLHADPEQDGYALGWGLMQRPWAARDGQGDGEAQGLALAHSGSNGLWFATIWLAPERNLALLAATNAATPAAQAAVDEAIAAGVKQAGEE